MCENPNPANPAPNYALESRPSSIALAEGLSARKPGDENQKSSQGRAGLERLELLGSDGAASRSAEIKLGRANATTRLAAKYRWD